MVEDTSIHTMFIVIPYIDILTYSTPQMKVVAIATENLNKKPCMVFQI